MNLLPGPFHPTIPPNSNTYSDWKRTCHVSWVKIPEGEQNSLSTRTWSGCVPWNRGKFVSQLESSKRFLCSFFLFFELGGITKHLITGPAGNSEFCFPFELNVRMSDWFINNGIVWCTEDEMNFNSNSKISDVKFSANFYLILANNFEQCDET